MLHRSADAVAELGISGRFVHMKGRNSSIVWFAGFATGLLLYIFGVTPIAIATRDSESIAGTIGWCMYLPVTHVRKHSERIDIFYQEQWYFWYPIVA